LKFVLTKSTNLSKVFVGRSQSAIEPHFPALEVGSPPVLSSLQQTGSLQEDLAPSKYSKSV